MSATWWIATAKLIWYASSITLFEYLSIPDTQLFILWWLMFIDFIFWIWKQFKIDRTKITSHRAWAWAFKKLSTLALVLSFALMLKWIEIDWSYYIKLVLSVFIMAEFYSITQNIYRVRTWIMLSEYDVISKIIKKLGDLILNIIEKKLKVEEDIDLLKNNQN